MNRYMLIEYDLGENWVPQLKERIFDSFQELLVHLSDEHYAEATCSHWVVVYSDVDQIFNANEIERARNFIRASF